MWKKMKNTPSSLTQRKNKMRIAPVAKLDLSKQNAKSYWNNVIENVEAQVTKVKHPSLILFPSLSLTPPIKCSASDNDNVNYNLVESNVRMRNIVRELIVRVSPPSPSYNESVSDIPLHDLRHDDHINYLKDCDIGNFELDFLHEKNSESEIDSNDKIDDIENEEIKKIENNIGDNFSSLNKIVRLSKISGYVNDFLASTRVKIKAPVLKKRLKFPGKSPRNNSDNLKSDHLFSDQLCDPLNNESNVVGSAGGEGIHPLEMISEPNKISPELMITDEISGPEKDEFVPNECLTLKRTRAPSLGVASAIPSFGKIVSSLEKSDSGESSSVVDNSSDDAKSENNVHPRKKTIEFSNKKNSIITKSKNYLQVNRVIPHPASSYPHPSRAHLQSNLPKLLSNKTIEDNKKFSQWRKQSITHIIKLLGRMKYRQKMKCEHDREISSKIHSEESSNSNTSTSTGSFQSIRQQFTNDNYQEDENLNKNLPQCITNDGKIQSDNPLIVTPEYFHQSRPESSLPTKLHNKSVIILGAIPQMNAMYPRKKGDKCLACLCESIGEKSKHENKFLETLTNIQLSDSRNAITDDVSILRNDKLSYKAEKTPLKAFIPSTKDSDLQMLTNKKNHVDNDIPPIFDGYSTKNINQKEAVESSINSSPSISKSDGENDKKNISPSKSFVSTLSLGSERSKTVSDQDDSDQAADEVGVTEKGIVESKSKYLVPCHAPINLRPSLEPLKALCGKKCRSIQSRMASLEKTTETGSDEECDENEIQTTIGKLNIDNKGSGSVMKIENRGIFRSDDTSNSLKFKAEDFDGVVEKIFVKNSNDQLMQTTAISNEIHSKLNMSTNILDFNPSESFRPSSPILPLSEVIEIAKNSLLANHDSIETLQILMNEYIKHLTEKESMRVKSKSSYTNKIGKIVRNLLALLVDSKLYLRPQFPPSHTQFSSKQKCHINSRQLKKVLPVKSYNLIAPILGIPEWHPKHWSAIKDARKLKSSSQKVTTLSRHPKIQHSSGSKSLTDIDLIVHPSSQRGSNSSKTYHDSQSRKQLNPYVAFLIKKRRKAVIWRPLTERDLEGYDPEATLRSRAAKITDEICSDFCQWLRSLGGYNTTINEKMLKNMFETDFTTDAFKTMQVSIKEMPMVPTVIANIRNCSDAGEVEKIRKLLLKDLKAEKRSTNLIGFGSALPHHLKFVPPKNHVEKNWLQCKNIPEDLETMDTIWSEITHLDSVKGFAQWLKDHPHIKPPAALNQLLNPKKKPKLSKKIKKNRQL